MPFSLFFSYANQDKAHFDEFAKSMKKFVESKDKEGKVLDCENEDLMEEYAENAFAIIVLLSTNYLNYDTSPQRKKLQTKINSGITWRIYST